MPEEPSEEKTEKIKELKAQNSAALWYRHLQAFEEGRELQSKIQWF